VVVLSNYCALRVVAIGTPLQNNLPELWALLNFLLPYIFGSMESFDQWFNQPFAAFQSSKREALTNGNDGADSDMAQLSQEERLLIVHRLHEVLRPFMLRRIKSQVLDQLPEKVEMVIRCRLSPWQKKLYKVIQERTRTILEGETKGGINNVIMQLRKVCNHPYLFLNEWYADDDLIRASGKFELLDRMLPKLKAGGHRILMFSQMTHAMTILERFFELKGRGRTTSGCES
jgi:SNF2 family DNA or RNA helicase